MLRTKPPSYSVVRVQSPYGVCPPLTPHSAKKTINQICLELGVESCISTVEQAPHPERTASKSYFILLWDIVVRIQGYVVVPLRRLTSGIQVGESADTDTRT